MKIKTFQFHDLVEDTGYTIKDLMKEGFSERVCRAVDILTHKDDVSYEDYIKAIALNDDARKVKMADLQDNSNICRLKVVQKKDFDRIGKYHKAFLYLSN